jgi:hypothetical protein
MKNLTKLAFAIIFASVLFTACSTEDNPLGPTDPGNGGPGPIVINTPRYMRVESITVTSFPATKPNGDKWDWNIFPNSPTRRPDIYVRLGESGSNLYVYRSDTREDAELLTAYDSYVFTASSSPSSGSLPYNVPMNETFNIDLMDDDGLSADDWMGAVNFTPVNYYNNDNVINFHETLSTSLVTIKIDGVWVY